MKEFATALGHAVVAIDVTLARVKIGNWAVYMMRGRLSFNEFGLEKKIYIGSLEIE